MYFFEERSSWALERFFSSAGCGWNYLLGVFFLSDILLKLSRYFGSVCWRTGTHKPDIAPKTKQHYLNKILLCVCSPKLCSACCRQGSISQLGTRVQPIGGDQPSRCCFLLISLHMFSPLGLQDGRVRPTKLEPPPFLNISLRSPCLTDGFCVLQINNANFHCKRQVFINFYKDYVIKLLNK